MAESRSLAFRLHQQSGPAFLRIATQATLYFPAYFPGVPFSSKNQPLYVPDKGTTSGEHTHARWEDAPARVVEHNWTRLHGKYSTAIMYFYAVEPVLQYGLPRCGFVAAAMAASIVGHRPNVDDMIAWAYHRSLTYCGDMFDIRNLKTICDEFVRVPSTVMEFPSDKDKMIADLVDGNCFLVPYDAGYPRGRPVMRNGYGAHWALVFGVVLMRSEDERSLMHLPKLSAKRGIYFGDSQYYNSHDVRNGEDFLLAQHGWQSEPQLWSINALRTSCLQLNEVGPFKEPMALLPQGGIQEGLRGKVLRLELCL